jgi:hypothetical protein
LAVVAFATYVGGAGLLGVVTLILFGGMTLVLAVAMIPGVSFIDLHDDGFSGAVLLRRRPFRRWTEVTRFEVRRVGYNITGHSLGYFVIYGVKDGGRTRRVGLPDLGFEGSAAALARVLNDWRSRAIERQ